MDFWGAVTDDCWVLQMVREGYHLEFLKTPQDRFWKVPPSQDPVQNHNILAAISHLIQIRAIEEVPRDQRGTRVYSVFFLVPKKNGGTRAILDLKWLNLFLAHHKFKMETW